MLLYDAASREQQGQINRFRDKAYGATYRSDGRLLVAGGETGIVQVLFCLDQTLMIDSQLCWATCGRDTDRHSPGGIIVCLALVYLSGGTRPGLIHADLETCGTVSDLQLAACLVLAWGCTKARCKQLRKLCPSQECE